jgi:hypothetical protein
LYLALNTLEVSLRSFTKLLAMMVIFVVRAPSFVKIHWRNSLYVFHPTVVVEKRRKIGSIFSNREGKLGVVSGGGNTFSEPIDVVVLDLWLQMGYINLDDMTMCSGYHLRITLMVDLSVATVRGLVRLDSSKMMETAVACITEKMRLRKKRYTKDGLDGSGGVQWLIS